MITKTRSSLLLFTHCLLLWGCTILISEFDQTALDKAEELKSKTLSLLDRATEPYSEQEVEINAIKGLMTIVYEYAKSRPQNSLAVKQWEIMNDPNNNLLAGFFDLWKDKGQLNQGFIDEAKLLISEAFEKIIELEKAKISNKPNLTEDNNAGL